MTTSEDQREQMKLATLIDACGSISMQAGGRIRLTISHLDVVLLIELKDKYGGTVTKPKAIQALGRPPRGKWTLVGRDVGNLLKQLRPMLSTRATQADLAIAHYEKVDLTRAKYQRRTVDQQVISYAIDQRLRLANKLNTVDQGVLPSDGDVVDQLIESMKKAAKPTPPPTRGEGDVNK